MFLFINYNKVMILCEIRVPSSQKIVFLYIVGTTIFFYICNMQFFQIKKRKKKNGP